MLYYLRNWLSGWVAAVLVLIFCIPFALWGTHYYFTASANPLVASLDDEEIRLQDFRQVLGRWRQLYRDQEIQLPPEEKLRQDVLERLLNGILIVNYADQVGMRISDLATAQAIRKDENLLVDDIFDTEQYELLYQQQGGRRLEERQRRLLLSQQVQQGVLIGSFVLDDEVRRIARMKEQTRDIRYAVFSVDEEREMLGRIDMEEADPEEAAADESDKAESESAKSPDEDESDAKDDTSAAAASTDSEETGDDKVADAAEEIIAVVDEEELVAYYDENKSEYAEQEQVQVEYLEITIATLADQLEIDEQSLRAFYDGRRTDYDIAERRKVSQVFVSAIDEAKKDASRDKAEALLQKLRDGELTMEELVEEENPPPVEETGSAAEGDQSGESETAAADDQAADEEQSASDNTGRRR